MKRAFILFLTLTVTGFAKERPKNPVFATTQAQPAALKAAMLTELVPLGYTIDQDTEQQFVLSRPMTSMETMKWATDSWMAFNTSTVNCRLSFTLVTFPSGQTNQVSLYREVVCTNGYGNAVRHPNLTRKIGDWLQAFVLHIVARAERTAPTPAPAPTVTPAPAAPTPAPTINTSTKPWGLKP